MNENHICNNVSKLPDVEIIFSTFHGDLDEKPNWWFHLFRKADEKDVEDGEADSIGEILSSTAVVISFCPFCGKKLDIRR